MKKIASKLILIISYILFLYLTTLSMFTTAVAGKNHGYFEYIFNIKDYPFMHFFSFFVFVFLLFIMRKKKILFFNEKKSVDLKIHFMIIAVICVVILLLVQAIPRADQLIILNSSTALRQGNLNDFYPLGYFDRYKNNKALAFIMYFLSYIIGGRNYIFFQMLNVGMVVGSIYYIYIFTENYFEDIRTNKLLLLFCYLFLPLFFYVTFVYGNLIGLFLSLAAINQRLVFNRTKKIKNILLCTIYIILACLIKNNFMIVAIALLIYFMLDLFNKSWKSLFFVAFFAILLPVSNWFVSSSMTYITKISEHNQQSTLTWLQIGLSENTNRAPGWWDEMIDTAWNNGKRNPDILKENVKNQVEKRIDELSKDSEYAIDFFARKNVSTWANPEFELNLLFRGNDTAVTYAPVIKSLTLDEGIVQKIILYITNIVQTMIYMGILLYVIFGGEERKWEDLIFLVIFIGGFLFHLVWETKSQYTVAYMFFVLPYCARGYISLLDRISSFSWKRHKLKNIQQLILSIAAIIFFVLGSVKENPVRSIVRFTKDDELYRSYLNDSKKIAQMSQKTYLIRAKNKKVYLNLKGSQKKLNSENIEGYKMIEENGFFRFQRPNTNKILSSMTLGEETLHYFDKDYQLWDFEKNRDGSYHIFRVRSKTQFSLTLSEDGKRVSLKPFDVNNDNQDWILEEKNSELEEKGEIVY